MYQDIEGHGEQVEKWNSTEKEAILALPEMFGTLLREILLQAEIHKQSSVFSNDSVMYKRAIQMHDANLTTVM